jgi:hypothetical protein
LLPSERLGNHYQCDLLNLLNQKWDLLIAHPPCTHLAVSGACWFPKKQKEQAEAIAFVRAIMDAPIKHIAIENPVGVLSTVIRKPDQIIHPYYFGDSFSKKTCLWLKNLPLLKPTKMVDPGEFITYPSGRTMQRWYADTWNKDHSKERSRTFQGIADAMANQWGTTPLPFQSRLDAYGR